MCSNFISEVKRNIVDHIYLEIMTSVLELIPEKIEAILLVDWPSPEIPRTLVNAGFTVFSYSPEKYSQALIEITAPGEFELIFRQMDHSPGAIDLVLIYRPPEEHEAIIKGHVLPLGARVIWLQPPVESSKTMEMAREYGLVFIEGHDIREILQER
jgi:predicted CoA-binding protein